jgi:Arylsulfotransferase (ASST)
VNTTSSTLQISYFNNDNSEVLNGTNSTTGLLLDVDIQARSVTLARKLQAPTEPLFADSQGSFQILPSGHVLLGYGQIAKTREFDAAGSLVYEAQYGYSTATSSCASYRSFRQAWVGQPATQPKVVAEYDAAANRTNVYMSWNGATTYDGWKIFTGSQATSLSVSVAEVAKSGFETVYGLEGKPQYVQVDALNGAQSLAWSSVEVVGPQS